VWKQLRISYQIICNHIESKWLTQVNDVDNLHRDGRVPVLHVERWITGQDSAHTETQLLVRQGSSRISKEMEKGKQVVDKCKRIELLLRVVARLRVPI
jgi:hypothetical protein